MNTTILKTAEENHEVLNTIISSTAESAQRAGEREARKYRAMGHQCKCVGVVEVEHEMPSHTGKMVRVPVGMGMYHCFERTEGTHIRKGYSPVIFPAIPTQDEE